MKNLIGFMAIAALVLQLVSHCAQAEDVISDKESLRGIQRIAVTTGKISRNAKKMGINKNSLRKYIELKLRAEGIAVANHDELHADSEIPSLQVGFYLSYSKPAYMYTLMVGLNQKVHSERDPKIISYAMPWWRIIRGENIGRIGFEKEIESTLRKISNEFVNDYFSVNPRQTIK
jgi:hypothetical protein